LFSIDISTNNFNDFIVLLLPFVLFLLTILAIHTNRNNSHSREIHMSKRILLLHRMEADNSRAFRMLLTQCCRIIIGTSSS
jgi:hypothetical protein